MNLKEYTEKSKETLTYSTNEKLISCCTMEIMGELTEYIEAYNSPYSTDVQLKKELGDVCYSLSILPSYFGIDIKQIKGAYETNNIDRQHSWPNLHDDGFFCLGKMQEIIKKVIRDDNWVLSNEQREVGLIYYFNSFFTYVITECSDNKWNLSDILSMNVEKLQSRKERNKLLGDGDER